MIRILLAEDDEAMRGYLARALQRSGYDVTTAATGREALDLVESGTFDLLLTDIVLHEASGLELAREAREAHPDIGIALMSGYVPGADEIPQGWHFIRKPLNAEALIQLVNEALTS